MPKPSKTGVRGLYKDTKDGRYRIDLRYVDRDGVERRHKERLPLGTTGGAAKLRAQEVLTRALAGTLHVADAPGPQTIKRAFAEYVELCGTGNPVQKARHCRELLASFGDVPISDVNELAIERFKKKRGASRSPATVNRELQTLRHFFTCAIEWKWADTQPKVRLLKEPPGRVRWLSDAERERLYAALPYRFKRVVLAAALCGQRLGNVIALTRDRADLANRSLSIPKTKSGKRHDVPISAALETVIKAAIADGDAMHREGKIQDPPKHVFLSRLGRPYTSSGCTALFRKCADRARVTDFTFHDLRHDFATRIRRAGHGLDTVQKLLGHASSTMTQRYAHIGVDELHQAVDAVAAPARVAPALPPGRKRTAKKARKK